MITNEYKKVRFSYFKIKYNDIHIIKYRHSLFSNYSCIKIMR